MASFLGSIFGFEFGAKIYFFGRLWQVIPDWLVLDATGCELCQRKNGVWSSILAWWLLRCLYAALLWFYKHDSRQHIWLWNKSLGFEFGARRVAGPDDLVGRDRMRAESALLWFYDSGSFALTNPLPCCLLGFKTMQRNCRGTSKCLQSCWGLEKLVLVSWKCHAVAWHHGLYEIWRQACQWFGFAFRLCSWSCMLAPRKSMQAACSSLPVRLDHLFFTCRFCLQCFVPLPSAVFSYVQTRNKPC